MKWRFAASCAALFFLLGQSAVASSNVTIAAPPRTTDLPEEREIGDIPYKCEFKSSGCRLSDFLQHAKVCALLVVRDGKYRFEKFDTANAFCQAEGEANNPKKLYGVASVAKSITSTLLGHAIATEMGARTRQDFEAALGRPVGSYLKELNGFIPSAYSDVPLGDVLRMRSGVWWSEYGWQGFFSGAAYFRKMVREEMQDSVTSFAHRYVFGFARAGFNYSALDAAIAAEVADSILGNERLTEFLQNGIWAAIGAQSHAVWGVDKAGTAIGPCCFKATVGDLARFGLLVLRQGRDEHENQIIPKAWFEIATKSIGEPDHIPSKNRSANAGWQMDYRYFWWLNRNGSDFTAVGRDGQFVHIFPDSNTVVVQISDWGAWKNGDALEVETFKAHEALVEAISRLP